MNQVDLGGEALWSLAIVSILAAFGTIFVFRRWLDRQALQATMNRMLAHMMEFRLFIDEPVLILQAQRDLFVENWHLLLLLTRPSLILIVPFAVLLAQMDACYGRAPLRVGHAAVLTVQFRTAGATLRSGVVLKTPESIKVETAGLRVVRSNQMSWRVRPTAPLSGHVQLIGAEQTVTKSITAGEGLHYLSERRVSSLPAFFLHLNELPLADSSIAWIEVLYPSASILHVHWLIWFVVISTATTVLIHCLPGIARRIMA